VNVQIGLAFLLSRFEEAPLVCGLAEAKLRPSRDEERSDRRLFHAWFWAGFR